MNLYPHNELAYKQLLRSLKDNKRACVVQPTGTGKSYISAKFLNDNPIKKFLILTSNSFIINQFDKNFKNFKNYDIYTYSSLIYSSFESIINKDYDYIILDEFHRAGADLWGKKLNELLDIKNNAKVIGLTATHIRNDIDDSGKYRNMASELFNSNLVHHLTLREAFDVGILPAPKYITSLYNLDYEYNNIIERIENSSHNNKEKLKKNLLERKLDWQKSKGVPNILKKHITSERNFIVFCKNIDHLKRIKPEVNKWFKTAFVNTKINTYKVHSNYNESKTEINEFIKKSSLSNNEFNLLFSVDQLNEGLHVPNIDGEILLRPTDSNIIYKQQFGRSLETKGKQPIIFDFVNNFNTNNSVNDILSNNKIKKDKNSLPVEISKKYKNFKYDFIIIDEVKEYKEIFAKIDSKIDDWLIKFSEFKKNLIAVENYENLHVEWKIWLRNQRHYANNLTKEKYDTRKKYLDSINIYLGFKWDLGKDNNDLWLSNFNQFRNELNKIKYYKKLDRKWKYWLMDQRKSYKKKSELWATRKEYLDTLNDILGFNWNDKNKNHEEWLKKFNDFKKALIETGDYNKIDSKFKRWISAQRKHINYNSNLWIERKKLLDSLNELNIDYNWNKKEKYIKRLSSKQISNWNKTYSEIKNKLHLEGVLFLTSNQKKWLNNQKREYNFSDSNKLLWKNRKKLLDRLNQYLGYKWNESNTLDKKWFSKFNSIKEKLLKGSYNNLDIKDKNWIRYQRNSYKKSNNSDLWNKRKEEFDKINELLGFKWDNPTMLVKNKKNVMKL